MVHIVPYEQDFFVKLQKTHNAQIRQSCHAVYLRDDIVCGIRGCKTCYGSCINDQDPPLVATDPDKPILFFDSTLAVQFARYLYENSYLRNFVLCQTVADHIKQTSFESYALLRSLCHCDPSATDAEVERKAYFFNNLFFKMTHVRFDGTCLDRAAYQRECIVEAIRWYRDHLRSNFTLRTSENQILLLTNCPQMQSRAKSAGIPYKTLQAHAIDLKQEAALVQYNIPEDNCEDDEDQVTEDEVYVPKITHRYEKYYSEAETHRLLESGELVQGVLKMDRYSSVCGNVTLQDKSHVRILGYKSINRAIDGDLVAVEIIPEKTQEQVIRKELSSLSEDVEELPLQRTEAASDIDILVDVLETALQNKNDVIGKVVRVLKRSRQVIHGTILPFKESKLQSTMALSTFQLRRFKPWHRFLPDILIRTKYSSQLANKRIFVVLDEWKRSHRYPSGHCIQIFGDVDDERVETELIYKEHDMDFPPFSTAIMESLPSPDFQVPASEIANRLDLRKLCVMSIDPPGCTDIDDALSCVPLPNGLYEVGVHIADVTFFVTPNSPLDREAAHRCTTVYLVNDRLTMLPQLLTEKLCSLRENEDHLTFSVIWTMTAEGEIRTTEFRKTVIHPCKSFTYSEAQQLLNRKHVPRTAPEYEPHKGLVALRNLSAHLRAKRIQNGALELASLDVVEDDETGETADITLAEDDEAHQLVEEFMLLANQSVSEKIVQVFPHYALLRRHSPPRNEDLQKLQEILAVHGYHLNFSSSKDLNESLRNIAMQSSALVARLIRSLTLRCMQRAEYVYTNCILAQTGQTNADIEDVASLYSHYGLAVPLYTHFTSPIRRYADILVHYLLAAALGLAELPEFLKDDFHMLTTCTALNRRHLNAQLASQASVRYSAYVKFKEKGVVTTLACVIRVKQSFVDILLPQYGLEHTIRPKEQTGFEWDADCGLCYSLGEDEPKLVIAPLDTLLVTVETSNAEFRSDVHIKILKKMTATDVEEWNKKMRQSASDQK